MFNENAVPLPGALSVIVDFSEVRMNIFMAER